jgi:transposase-like protein
MTDRKTGQEMSTGVPTSEREAAIVAAYQAGTKVSAIEAEFGVGRSTLYHVLRRSGVMPARSRKQLDAASHDTALAGLHELIRHQDHLLAERDTTIAELRRENNELRTRLGDGKDIPTAASKSAARSRSRRSAAANHHAAS